ncbi:anti-CBASS protein Acb1 family protein [Dickeya solani]|uniref:DUF1073 domain-containing protein n=1 Tax=Dickeya solani TaxID=1089444 RepID=A0ABU4EPW6_9GAMM|nr:anti-CBASS Acb1 family protein [Dickeya solani]MCA6998208.1 DUF1073 domain-containing protein [Dickeya solani]MDV6997161.1 DUF1073 domain-containing protein [Dickeya solani]MDV7004472.1 DUF1073 domain-containing protein [Dickeya solani]MDV7040366.1 DUF1073 domain-containing protein [Dickeya solani]MDV7044817.1 DUF1073 domain-containing protein [Dickeya solani]
MTESEMKAQQRANNSLERDRVRVLGSLLYGTSNTKRGRLYQEFGYPVHLTFDDFYRAYRRNAVAGAAVKRMVDGCWEDMPEIYEGSDNEKATQQTAWDKRINKLLKRCWQQIKGADRRNLVGRYSAILLQIKDSQAWDQPVNTAIAGQLKERALVRMIPAWEAQIDPIRWDEDAGSESFGQPTMYSFVELSVGGRNDGRPGRIINVHPDRVIILAEGSDDGNLFSGTSLLEEGFNKLLDIEKVSGGASEGFLKNASRQLNFNFSDKTNFSALARALGVKEDQLADAMDDQVRRLNENLDAANIMQAGDASVLSVDAADPEPTWRTALSEFCATVPIPVKELIGMQTGERASTEDAKGWAKTRKARREGFLTDIITEIVTRFWILGIIELPANSEITVEWSDLLAPSEADKIDNMGKMADVAVKTTNAFGRSALTENEIREVGGLQPDPTLDNDGELNGNRPTRPDPLNPESQTPQPGNTT